jgi:ribosomal protein S21
MAHTNLDFDKKFKKVKEQQILIAKLKKRWFFEINILRKHKEASKLSSKEAKAIEVLNKGKQYFFNNNIAKETFDQLMHGGKIKPIDNHTIPITKHIEEKKYCKLHDSWRLSINSCVVFRNPI